MKLARAAFLVAVLLNAIVSAILIYFFIAAEPIYYPPEFPTPLDIALLLFMWSTPFAIGMGIIGVCALTLFVVRETDKWMRSRAGVELKGDAVDRLIEWLKSKA